MKINIFHLIYVLFVKFYFLLQNGMFIILNNNILFKFINKNNWNLLTRQYNIYNNLSLFKLIEMDDDIDDAAPLSDVESDDDMENGVEPFNLSDVESIFTDHDDDDEQNDQEAEIHAPNINNIAENSNQCIANINTNEQMNIDDDDDDDDNIVQNAKKRRIAEMQQYVFRPFEICKINEVCADGAGNISMGNSVMHGSSSSGQLSPGPRSGHRTICTNSDLYCLGGFNPRQNLTIAARRPRTTFLFQELWRYNFVTKKWKLILNHKDRLMPEELASNAVTIHNNVIIAYGGTGFPFGENCSNHSYVFCTNKPFVRRIEVEGDLPTPMYGPAIVVHNNQYLYTVGGTTGFDYSCDVFRLDLKTKIWQQMYICRPEMRDDDPKGRYRHEIVYDGKTIYILGGGTSSTAFDLKLLPAFNIELNKWEFLRTKPDKLVKSENGGYPESRKCYSCVQYTINENENEIEAVIAGGYGESEKCYSDIWKLNFKTFEWKLLRAALPNPIYFHSASTPGNGCMYLFGGIEINGVNNELVRTNDLYKIWTTIPKLSEICWDSICYYNSKLDSYSKDELLSYGIPQKFVERVPDSTKKIKNDKLAITQSNPSGSSSQGTSSCARTSSALRLRYGRIRHLNLQ